MGGVSGHGHSKLFTGSDHAGFELRGRMVAHLRALGFEVEDLGSPSAESTDYPDWAAAVGRAVREHAGSLGVLVCGTGLGVCMAANKIHGVRAVDVWSVEAARLSRAHNDANVLCVGARLVPEATAFAIVDAWLDTEFEGGRHARRVGKIAALEIEEARAAPEARGTPQMKTASKETSLHQVPTPSARASGTTTCAAACCTSGGLAEADRAGRARHDVEPDHLREGDRLVG